MAEVTENLAWPKVKTNMPGAGSYIAERCLNHKIKGAEDSYNWDDYFEERKAALQSPANFLEACETGTAWNVTPIRKAMQLSRS